MIELPLLSSREKKLLRRLASGQTDEEIASQIGGTAKQISEQRARLLEKLKITTAPAEIADAAAQFASLTSYKGARRF